MKVLKFFSLFFTIYSFLAIISFFINNENISLISFIFAFISAFFLRREFKKIQRQEFKIPYAGAYLMVLGYLGIIVGIPLSFFSSVHLLGLTLVLIGALFVDIGILTALVLGNYRLSKLFHDSRYNILAILFLIGLILNFTLLKDIADLVYLISSFFILVESL